MRIVSVAIQSGLLLAVAFFSIQAVQAQDFLEPPTIGEVVGSELSSAFQHAQEAAKHKAEFSVDLRRARSAYFEAYRKDPENKRRLDATEAEFSRLLYAKDFYFLTFFIAEGVTSETVKRTRSVEAMTGGLLDDGIPQHAWSAFTTWVFDVRLSLGVTDFDQIIIAPKADEIWAAINSSRESYLEYKVKRDEAEFIAQGLMDPPRPRFLPPPEILKQYDELYAATMGKLYPDLKKHEFASCIIPAYGQCDGDRNDKSTPLYRLSNEAAYYHYPGVYQIESLRSPMDSDKIESISGRCVVVDHPLNPPLGLVELPDGSRVKEMVFSQKRVLCSVGQHVYSLIGQQTYTAGLTFPALHATYETGYRGPVGNMFPLSLKGETLVGYEASVGGGSQAGKSRVTATKMVRIGNLGDLNAIDLPGMYEVTLRFGHNRYEIAKKYLEIADRPNLSVSDIQKSAPDFHLNRQYHLKCSFRILPTGEFEFACLDEDGNLYRTSAGEFHSSKGRHGADGAWEVIKPFINVGQFENSTFRTDIRFQHFLDWFIFLDPEDGLTRSNSPKLMMMIGDTYGELKRIGDPAPLNDEDRHYLESLEGGSNKSSDRSPSSSASPGTKVRKDPTEPTNHGAVSDGPPAVLTLTKTKFKPGEVIDASIEGLSGSRTDWVTLVSSATPENEWGAQWVYTNSKLAGSWSFNAPAEPGRYEIRVYFNWPDGGFTVKARESFEIVIQ